MIRFSRAPALLACLVIGALVLILPATVAAHAELETSTLADGATVPSPFDGPIVLGFSATLASGSKADLLGPDGTVIASAAVDGPGAKMTFPLALGLAPGAYEVRWVSVAEDTDLKRGTISFTVTPAPPTASPSASPTPAPTASAGPTTSAAPSFTASPASTASPAPPSAAPSGSGDASTSAADVVLPIVVALIVIGAGAAYLLRRRASTTTSR